MTEFETYARELGTRTLAPYHIVAKNESLSLIVNRYYFPRNHTERQRWTEHLARVNAIQNPNLIFPGQFLVLPETFEPFSPLVGDQIRSKNGEIKAARQEEREAIPVLDSLLKFSRDEGLGMGISGTGGVFAGIGANMVSIQSRMRELAQNYERYVKGKIDRNTYNRNRIRIKSQIRGFNADKLNLTAKYGKSFRRSVRAGKKVSVAPIIQHVDRLKVMSKALTAGGVALIALDLGVSCHSIAQPGTTLAMRNEIAVGSLFSNSVGIGAGFLLGFFLATSPVGWVTVIALGAAAGALAWGSGYYAKKLYRGYTNRQGPVDIVDTVGITSVCRGIF